MDFLIEITQSLDLDNGQNGIFGTRVGMLTFGNEAKLAFQLNEYNDKQDLLGAVNVRYTGGTTNTADAIR